MVYVAFWAGLYLHLHLHSYREPAAPGQRTLRRGESCAASSDEALRNAALLHQATEPDRNALMDYCKMQLGFG